MRENGGAAVRPAALMRLELGSGERPTPGYVHLDLRDVPDVDIVDDATRLNKVSDASCQAIRATHLLEHFSWRRTTEILTFWRSKLIEGGELYLEVPNLTGHVLAWRSGTESDARFVEMLYGEQDHEFNYHYTGFTAATLQQHLKAAGFRMVSTEDIGCVLIARARR